MHQSLDPEDRSARVYVIHENDEWVVPLRKNFEARGIRFAEWHLDEGILDLRTPPPPGVFYNRMSASSHTRDHRYAPELTAAVLSWLKGHGAVVVNGERADRGQALESADLLEHGWERCLPSTPSRRQGQLKWLSEELASILKEREQLPPKRQIWWRSARPWVTGIDGFEKFQKGLP